LEQIKERLKSGVYILTERKHVKSEVWKSFREVQDATTKEKIGVV
jgi:hypothetical protein